MKKSTRGFTLTELVIAMAIVGILAAVAIPSYTRYAVRNNRTGAETTLMDIAQRETQYLLDNRRYANTVADLGITVPASVSKFYTIAITTNAGPPPTFTATATPVAGTGQVADGALSINNAGVKTPSDKW